MAELKTRPNNQSVSAFIKNIEHPQRKADCQALLKLMKNITGKRPKMWGDSLVGFGNYHYKYKSGHEGDWFVTGFSPRKAATTIYIMPGFSNYPEIMAQLGKYKTGKSCLYVNKLADINLALLEALVRRSIDDMAKMYDCS